MNNDETNQSLFNLIQHCIFDNEEYNTNPKVFLFKEFPNDRKVEDFQVKEKSFKKFVANFNDQVMEDFLDEIILHMMNMISIEKINPLGCRIFFDPRFEIIRKNDDFGLSIGWKQAKLNQ